MGGRREYATGAQHTRDPISKVKNRSEWKRGQTQNDNRRIYPRNAEKTLTLRVTSSQPIDAYANVQNEM